MLLVHAKHIAIYNPLFVSLFLNRLKENLLSKPKSQGDVFCEIDSLY
jgi:hypothetical protein